MLRVREVKDSMRLDVGIISVVQEGYLKKKFDPSWIGMRHRYLSMSQLLRGKDNWKNTFVVSHCDHSLFNSLGNIPSEK